MAQDNRVTVYLERNQYLDIFPKLSWPVEYSNALCKEVCFRLHPSAILLRECGAGPTPTKAHRYQYDPLTVLCYSGKLTKASLLHRPKAYAV